MATPPPATNGANGQITEAEASLYDRQIRLWGLEAQNRMRSSTVLVLSLRGIAHETIKNLVLAGIGRLIIMDGDTVTNTDLGTGFLFREEDGAVGTERTAAALPQIASLNPLVTLTAFPTLAPFTASDSEVDMVAFLQREKVDVVVACDLPVAQLEAIDSAARAAGSMFYGAGTYGFFGWVFADLGASYDYVVTPAPTSVNPNPSLVKKRAAYASLTSALQQDHWALSEKETASGGSAFRGLSRSESRALQPQLAINVLAVWEFSKRHGGALPAGAEGEQAELAGIAEEMRKALGVHTKALPSVDAEIIAHLAQHARRLFAPTLAIVGGLLAQDVLRTLSRKDTPIANLLAVDTMGGNGAVSRWAMAPAVDEVEA